MADFDIGGIKQLGGMEFGRISEVPGAAEITVDRYGTVILLPAQYYVFDNTDPNPEHWKIANTSLYNTYVAEGAYCSLDDDHLSIDNPHLISDGNGTFEYNNMKGDLYCVMKQNNVNVDNVVVDNYNNIMYYFIFIDTNGNKYDFLNTSAIMQNISITAGTSLQYQYYNSVGDNKLNYCYLTELVNVYGNLTAGLGFAAFTGDINQRIYVPVETFYTGKAMYPPNPPSTEYTYKNFIGVNVLKQGFIDLSTVESNPDFSYTNSGTGTYDNSSDDIGLP